MSTPNNLLRDLVHVAPGLNTVAFGSSSPVGSTITINNTAVVNQTAGSAKNSYTTTGSTGINNWFGAGLFMSQPIVDATPYRVKAWTSSGLAVTYLVVGYGPLAPTGSSDQLTKVTAFPISNADSGQGVQIGHFDEILLIPGLTDADPDFGKPIGFGIGIAVASGVPAVAYNISVQNLAKTAPQFAASMS